MQQKVLSYDTYRSMIKNGDVLLYSGTDPVSKLIQSISDSEYSHAGIAVWWNDRLMVLEAQTKGVVASRLSDNLKKYNGGVDYYWCKKDITDDKRTQMVAFAQEQLGKEYNYIKVAASGLRAALGLSMKNQDGSFKHPAGKYFCSQFVSEIYHMAGMDLAINLSSDRTSPQAIADSPLLVQKGILKIG